MYSKVTATLGEIIILGFGFYDVDSNIYLGFVIFLVKCHNKPNNYYHNRHQRRPKEKLLTHTGCYFIDQMTVTVSDKSICYYFKNGKPTETWLMVGDNANAHVAQEVITPLPKLQAMLPTNGIAQHIQTQTALGEDLSVNIRQTECNQV